MECSEAQPFMDESLACGCKKQCQALLLLLLLLLLHTSESTTIDTSASSSTTSITLLLNYSTTSTTVTTTTTNFWTYTLVCENGFSNKLTILPKTMIGNTINDTNDICIVSACGCTHNLVYITSKKPKIKQQWHIFLVANVKWRPFWKIAAKGEQGQISMGSLSRFIQNTLVNMCTNFSAFMKKWTICLLCCCTIKDFAIQFSWK